MSTKTKTKNKTKKTFHFASVEMYNKTFHFASVEIYNSHRFGDFGKCNFSYLNGQFMVVETFYYNSDDRIDLPLDKFFKRMYRNIAHHDYYLSRFLDRQSTSFLDDIYFPVRNILSVSRSSLFLQPQIVERIVLPTEETICIIKTVWIRIVQRRWKKIYAQRKRMLQNMYLRNIYGKLSSKRNLSFSLPSLKGMLADLGDK